MVAEPEAGGCAPPTEGVCVDAGAVATGLVGTLVEGEVGATVGTLVVAVELGVAVGCAAVGAVGSGLMNGGGT